MNNLNLLLISIFFLSSFFIGVYSWLYVQKVRQIAVTLHTEVPAKVRLLLQVSFFIASLTAVISILFFILASF